MFPAFGGLSIQMSSSPMRPSLWGQLLARLQGEVPADTLEAYRRACSWNAFLLQTLGDQFLDADYRANPASVGFVPPVTAEQVLASTSGRSPTRGRAPTGSATQRHAARSRRCGRTIQILAGPWRCRTK
jgi:hypothetical protein